MIAFFVDNRAEQCSYAGTAMKPTNARENAVQNHEVGLRASLDKAVRENIDFRNRINAGTEAWAVLDRDDKMDVGRLYKGETDPNWLRRSYPGSTVVPVRVVVDLDRLK